MDTHSAGARSVGSDTFVALLDAYRCSDVAETEDIVQNAFLRWRRDAEEDTEIDSANGYRLEDDDPDFDGADEPLADVVAPAGTRRDHRRRRNGARL